MSEYTIKQYQKEFIEDQFKVGSEVVKDWKYFFQTSVEQLKQTYSREDFDPETRLYCFKDDKMVGFLTARVVEGEEPKFGFLRLPFVLPKYEEVAELLFNEILEVFKKKGVNNIKTIATDFWGNTLDLIKRWNFNEKDASFYLYELDMKNIPDFEIDETIEIEDFNYETDLDQIIKIFIEQYNYTEEQAIRNFEAFRNNANVYAHLVVKEKNEIKGRALAYFTEDPKVAINGYIYGESKIREMLQREIFRKSKEKKVEKLQMTFNRQNVDKIQLYEEFGFKLLKKIMLFEKDI